MSPIAADVSIDELLAGFGLTGEAAADARRILEADGLTNPHKQRIATAKTALARDAIDLRWQRLCHNCEPSAAADGRPVVRVPAAFCASCGGSSNARAVAEMTRACREAVIVRLLVVGGSPNMRAELEELVGGELELRLVDGTKSSNRAVAQGNIAWADLIVVLGATQLAHKVSTLYTRDPDARWKLVTTSRRGLEAIAGDVARSDVVRGARSV